MNRLATPSMVEKRVIIIIILHIHVFGGGKGVGLSVWLLMMLVTPLDIKLTPMNLKYWFLFNEWVPERLL